MSSNVAVPVSIGGCLGKDLKRELAPNGKKLAHLSKRELQSRLYTRLPSMSVDVVADITASD
jgi:hypothetical protein